MQTIENNNELTEWKSHPFTQRYMKFLFFRMELCKQDWAKELFVGNDMQGWALKNAKALGGIAVLNDLIDLQMEDITESEKEANEYLRNQARRLDGIS